MAVWKTADYADVETFLATDRTNNICEGNVGVLGAEDDNGSGDAWCIPIGAYSKAGEGPYLTMTEKVPNDELSFIVVPSGLSCYVTDEDSFGEGGDGVGEYPGFYSGMVEPDGKVSSIAVWDSSMYDNYADFLATY